MSNQFKSAFNTIYNVRIKCPSCKEEIHAHAKKCPFCHTDFTSIHYTEANKWQEKAKFALLVVIGIIALTMLSSGINILVLIVGGLVFYGLGYFVILKIQSFLNSMK